MIRSKLAKIAAAAAAGIVVGGLWGAAESLAFVIRYGTSSEDSTEFFKLVLNYSAHWALFLGALALLIGIFSRAGAESFARGFWRYAAVGIAGGAFFYLFYRVNAFWLTDRLSVTGLLTNGGILAGTLVAIWLLSFLFRRMPEKAARAAAAGAAVLWLAALVAGAAPLADKGSGGGGSTAAQGSNVLIVLLDALRADHVGCYGYERPVTPFIDSVAQDGVRFERFIATSSWTRPTTATILTGMFPTSHDQNWLVSVLPPGTVMMPDYFGPKGFETVFISANPLVNRASGLAQEVDYYAGCGTMFNSGLGWCLFKADKVLHHIFKQRVTVFFSLFKLIRDAGDLGDSVKKPGSWVNAKFLDWLDGRRAGSPFFAYLHYMDPHTPYRPREPYESRFRDSGYDGPDIVEPPLTGRGMPPIEPGEELPEAQRRLLLDRYDGEIASVDAYVADLFAALKERGLYDSTLILILADHGEGFYDHLAWTHGNSLFQELIHVPLILRLPQGEGAGTVVADLCSQMDIFPTILDFLGLERHPRLQGRSLMPLLRRQDQAQEERPVLSEMRFADKYYTSMIQEGLKVVSVVAGEVKKTYLFDLTQDPDEHRSLDAERPEVLEKMLEDLRTLIQSFENKKIDSQRRRISDEDMEKIKQLGYGG